MHFINFHPIRTLLAVVILFPIEMQQYKDMNT